jgi:outer membrane protein insertion porin family/translocation and assembly module TamA
MATLGLSRATWAAVWAASALGAFALGCTHVPPGRYAIDRVDIVGASKVDVDEVEDKIATAASPRFLGLFRGVVLDYELFDPYVLERDLARIERLYRARGFYEAHARAGRVEKVGPSRVRVMVVVDEGPPVTVGQIKIDGIATLPIDHAAAVLAAVRRRLRAGRNFDEERYDTAQDELKRALTDSGYAFAKVEGRVEVDLSRHVADVFLDVTPGPLARLGAVTITGLGPLPELPVRRAIDLDEGELYSTANLESARRAILALGVFSEAEVEPDLSKPSSPTVPVNVVVTPSELRSLRLGGGIELDVIRTDVHAIAGWEDRNFLGGLRRFNVDLRPGVVLYPTRVPTFRAPKELLLEARARAELRQPGVLEARTNGIVRGEVNVYPVLFADPKATTQFVPGYLDLSAGYGLDRSFGPFYASLFYNFQNSFPFDYGAETQNFRKVVLSYLNLKTTLDLRDDAIRPHAGLVIGNDLQLAGLPVLQTFRGPDVLFAKDVRLQPELRGYVPLSRRWTLALRATTGFVYPFPSSYGGSLRPGNDPSADDIQLVFFRGFFSGGPNSNRGYPYRGVGPKGDVSTFLPGLTQDDVFPTGGLSLWEASVEVRFPLSGDLGGVAFCDASDVSRYKFDIRLLYPHLSCGAGLRYDTPVGAIGLDLGVPIPGLQALDKNALPSEKVPAQTFAVSIGIESR